MDYRVGDVVNFNWLKDKPFRFNKSHLIRKAIQLAQYVELRNQGFDFYTAWDHASYTHTGMIIQVTPKKYVVAEALDEGYVFCDYDKDYFHTMVESEHFRVVRPIYPVKNVKAEAQKLEGRPYSWLNIATMGLSTILRVLPVFTLFGKGKFLLDIILNYTDKKVVCSEANTIVAYNTSNKKINLSAEFGVVKDKTMPFHYLITKFYKRVTHDGD